MENSSKALELAFAVMVFVMALTVAMTMFTKAREASEAVLKASDQTQYYSYINADSKSEFRIVSFETIVPTLYKYDKERYKVTFKKGSYNEQTGEITNVTPLAIYTTKTQRNKWNKDYTNDYDNKTTNSSAQNELRICSFDIVEETQRNEPWVGNTSEIKKHLDTIFSGGTYHLPQYSNNITRFDISYTGNPLNITYGPNSRSKFIEQVGKITTTEERTDNTTGIKGNKTTTKTVITYILIN